VRWRVMPARGGARLEMELVGDVVTENVHVTLDAWSAEQLAADLRACVAGHREAEADLDARN